MHSPMRVVILGGGFGGLNVVQQLRQRADSSQLAITLIDSSPVHAYTPWFYRHATQSLHEERERGNELPQGTIALTDISGIRFRQQAILHIDHVQRHVLLADQTSVAYDILVIALGSVAHDFGIPGVRQYAYEFKTLSDSVMIRHRLAALVHAQRSAQVVVMGAGFSGVECAAECAWNLRRFERLGVLEPHLITVTLMDTLPNPLGKMSPFFQTLARRRLEHLGVRFLMSTALQSMTNKSLTYRTCSQGIPTGELQQLSVDCAISALGVRTPEIVSALPLAHDGKGRLVLDAFLRVQGESNIFALGDCATVFPADMHNADPQTAQAAVVQSRVVAQNILRIIRHRSLKTYRCRRSWPTIVTLGGRYALGDIYGVPVVGFFAFLLRQWVDIRYFARMLSWRSIIKRISFLAL